MFCKSIRKHFHAHVKTEIIHNCMKVVISCRKFHIIFSFDCSGYKTGVMLGLPVMRQAGTSKVSLIGKKEKKTTLITKISLPCKEGPGDLGLQKCKACDEEIL